MVLDVSLFTAIICKDLRDVSFPFYYYEPFFLHCEIKLYLSYNKLSRTFLLSQNKLANHLLNTRFLTCTCILNQQVSYTKCSL